MSFRSLASYEKTLLSQSYDNQINGTIFSAKYINSAGDQGYNDDAITLTTQKESPTMYSMITRALAVVVKENPELYTTINTRLEFEPLQEIKADDVISSIKFGSLKDELVNCKNGAPPYLLRHIFNKHRFVPGDGKPLWHIYVVDDSIVIFHGQDVLFDLYSAANFHKKFFAAMNSLSSKGESAEYLFRLSENPQTAKNYQFPKSIYDSPILFVPAKTIELVSLQTRSFVRSVFNKAIVKPYNFITLNDEPMREISNCDPMNILEKTSSLCGTTIFGQISHERFEYLRSIAQEENICTKSLICGITLLCLKPIIKDFTSSITFSVAMNLRPSLEEHSDFGLFYKNINIEVPLSLIDDNVFKMKCSFNGYDASNTNLNENNQEYAEKLVEFQFKQISNFVSKVLKQRMDAWKRNGFNDDDIKKMKFESKDKTNATKIIQINEISDFAFCPMNKNGEPNDVKVKDLSFTHSLVPNQFMSLSYTHCAHTGTNICIHYPEVYELETFVEQFQLFISGE